MKKFKNYIADRCINQKLRFVCDCIFPMDIIGIIKDYEIINNEIIFHVEANNKIIKIGENHPNLMIYDAN